jgi:hypothetical protein
MGKDPSASDEFLRLLKRLDEIDGDQTGPAVDEISHLNRGFVFVPSLARSGERASSNISQWLDHLEWLGPEDKVAPADPSESELTPHQTENEDVTPAAVRRELDLIAAEVSGRGARKAVLMATIRRIYAARHHPDRVAPALRPLATRRMMLANMLIDIDEREAGK